MSFAKAREETRQGAFKKATDTDGARRAREETTIQIRKEKKSEHLNRRRRITQALDGGGATLDDPVLAQKLESPGGDS